MAFMLRAEAPGKRTICALLIGSLASAQLQECKDNSDCTGAKAPNYSDGMALPGESRQGSDATITYRAVENASATYCAALPQLNGSKACWPCKFTATYKVGGKPIADGDRMAWQRDGNQTCYTQNGMITPAGVKGEKPETYRSIPSSGCDVCDAIIPLPERAGVTGTVCYVAGDCQKGFYCSLLTKLGDTCQMWPPAIKNEVCDQPLGLGCEFGTDNTDCPQHTQMCEACGDEDQTARGAWGAVNCHELTPAYFKDFALKTKYEHLVIYLTLASCSLIYPLWCVVVFALKNSTRCCGGAKYTWGM